ncbi:MULTISPECIES: AAA family ATPase [Burkholderia cepacia complex]|uniref:AAA family ATPase n=1 Tax=Burkholderia cepacia complex TaxID=87882 RepID=UPI000277D99C|nr:MULTISPECIES: AAA family ATPase [Burkholderia cepacia complex]EJO59482.1 CobQ/CobB/MinD/ParA nucleotide binding domain protein [Burkholderia multivorans CF2]MBR8086708.1 AAA family ATPase [Burkholderia vietnamiensis]MBU9409953.1 AAA family ATPase [Burkholderia multivorans]MBU9469624.1 AAA family ATPase [Burkholderia multivorans]MDR8873357.1 Chromosome partitioning protein ParA [Burkholderia multivorans]
MIVVVGNPKGGVGKSTIAVQLATGISAAGARVWLVDGDRQESSASAMAARLQGNRPAVATAAYYDGTTLHAELTKHAGQFDHVVVDAGGRDSSAFRAAMMAADVVLVPVMPRSFDVWALDDMAKLLAEARKVRALRACAFLNCADVQGADNRDAEAVIAGYDGLELLPYRIHRRKAFANASAAGLHVEEMPRRDPVACAEIERLQDAVFGVVSAAAAR